MKSKTKSLIAAVSVLAVVGLGVGAAQVAQADTATPSGPNATQGTQKQGAQNQSDNSTGRGMGKVGQRGMQAHQGMQSHRGGSDLAAELADKLGIEQSKVEDAFDAIRATMTPRAERGTAPTDEQRAEHHAQLAEALAGELGVSADDITKALDEIQAERQAERAAGFDSRIDQAVQDGTLTAAEGAAVKKAAEAGVIGMGGGGPRR